MEKWLCGWHFTCTRGLATPAALQIKRSVARLLSADSQYERMSYQIRSSPGKYAGKSNAWIFTKRELKFPLLSFDTWARNCVDFPRRHLDYSSERQSFHTPQWDFTMTHLVIAQPSEQSLCLLLAVTEQPYYTAQVHLSYGWGTYYVAQRPRSHKDCPPS